MSRREGREGREARRGGKEGRERGGREGEELGIKFSPFQSISTSLIFMTSFALITFFSPTGVVV